MESIKSDEPGLKFFLKTAVILTIWVVLILSFPNKVDNMEDDNKPIHWVLDKDSVMLIAMNKTRAEADSVKDMYPNRELIILKQVE